MGLQSGTRLGHFEIVAKLGEGGMGEVYRARDAKLNRDIAIKILPPAFAQDAERLARFTREAQTLAALNHPHIAHIHGLEESGDVRALVMELVDGEDLTAHIARGPMPLADALPIARQIADALEAAHEQGIIHRDLKPANVKVRADGTVKVLDFGLAKALAPDGASASAGGAMSSPTMTSPAMTAMGIILGTAAYMSPEQAKGRPVDRRADVWAFGVVLYEMLTGRRLFEAEDVSETLAAVLTRDVSLTSLPSAIPPRLRALLRDCLVRDPKQRLRDIGDARLVLDRLIAGESDAAFATSAAVIVAPLWRRALPWVAAAVAVIGTGVGAWRLKPEPVRTVSRFSFNLPEGQNFSNTGRQLVAVSPDGTKLVYVANQRLYLREISALESHPIPGSESDNAAIGPAFSPDGRSLVFFTGGAAASFGSLKRLSIAGGAAVSICPATNPLGVSWDDSGIVFGQVGKGILRVSADGGEPQVIAAAGTDEVLAGPRMLPGARAVLFSVKRVDSSWDEGAVVVQTLTGGARKTLVQGGSDGRYLPTGHLVYAVSGVLLSAPFDLNRLAVSGSPVPLVEGIRRPGLSGGRASSGAAQFDYSSTGTLAFVPGPARVDTGGSSDLAIFDRKGTARRLGLPPGSYRSPRVSRDGNSVVFDTDDGREAVIWIYELAGGTAMRRLTFGGRNQDPIWSPDGQWVAFRSDRDGDQAIFRQRADGSGTAERLTRPEAGVAHFPHAFSPDGAFLLYSVFIADPAARRGPVLWTLSIQDRKATAFGVELSNSFGEGVFSPDGHWIAYQAREPGATGPVQTFVQPFPPTGAKYLVGNGGHPYWSPKGDQLILNVGPGLSAIIPVKTTPAVTFGKSIDFPRTGRTELAPVNIRRNADSLPDGEHIIGVTSGPPGAPELGAREIVVVLNWFDEVRRKVR